jgi:hypothetical protein
MKRSILKGIACLLFLLVPLFSLLADPPGTPSPGEDPTLGGNPPVGGPIDGGLGILLAFGAGYGGWKYYKRKKHAGDEESPGQAGMPESEET